VTCRACASFNERPTCGAYDFRCVECMARLIKSARPLKRLQQGHIAALERFHGAAWGSVWVELQKSLQR
jgi:hypothetical protein